MKTSVQDNQAQSLRFLPRDRKTLDYILSKLAVNSSPERFDLLQELFEMHRTSVGFDPSVLSKGRFKRFKAFEIRQVLNELEEDLAVILSSNEFNNTNEVSNSYKDLFNQYLSVVEMLSAPPSKSLNDQVDNFCRLLMQEGAYELLLAFYRQGYHHFAARNVRIDQVISNYGLLTETLDYQNAVVLSGLQTVRITHDSFHGNVTQEELLLHFNFLQKLIQQSDVANIYELKGRAVRIGLLLDKRSAHIHSLVKDVFVKSKTRVIQPADLEAELICAAALFDHSTPLQQKLDRLSTQSVNKTLQPLRIVQTKITAAQLAASAGDFSSVHIAINEAEHLLIKHSFRNVPMKKAWMDLHVLRFFIYITEEINGSLREKAEYNVVLQAVRETGDEISEARLIADALQALLHSIKQETDIARTLITEWIDISRNKNYLSCIMEYLSVLISLKPAVKKAVAAEHQLRELREPFFSDVFCSVLKKLAGDKK
jgi:hypothetical protein